MKYLINYINSLEILLDNEIGEYVLMDTESGECSEKSFQTVAEAQDFISEFTTVIQNLSRVDNAMRFNEYHTLYELEDFDFNILNDSWVAKQYYGTNAKDFLSTDCFDTIILCKEAYAPFCEMCDFCNNWGVFDSMSYISLDTEDNILNSLNDTAVLVWNESEGEYKMLENDFLADAAARASKLI